MIPTYEPAAADKNPMFLEKRVYQGSSGRVYPLPIVDRISETKVEKTWEAVHIENEFVRVMVLPELGGRIHVGMDKTNQYDFFYRQNVIKPALVGLAGPWASGGVEFNWPQHHRPSTYMPTEVEIEKHADGSVTVWCSEHEPMNRMKGMHGVCLHPGSSVVELKARIYNRTELVQTFLWWANVATRVHELYQSFFPPDVSYVADHATRSMSRFPGCEGMYYGVDYGRRAREGVPVGDVPREFVPPGSYPANDLSWYANIPVPTSYMAMGSRADFMGGYDHRARAGLVHVADRHVSPGKKQWTWGNHEFGYAWDRNLTDEDGPYIELMAGVYTDNQPDFSFLHPGETRTWSQYWYPIREMGPAQAANQEAALSVIVREGKVRVGVVATSVRKGTTVTVSYRGAAMESATVDLGPDMPFVKEYVLKAGAKASDVRVAVTHGGRELVSYQVAEKKDVEVPPAAKEPELPGEIANNEQLYLTGLHLEQYRHATRSGEAYWREAVRRDPMDSRCQNALGVWHLRRGEFEKAVGHFQEAIRSLTRYNPNPADGEAFYHLGIALRYLGRDEEAYDALYKATWNYAWQSAGFFALAQIDCTRGEWERALEHLERVLRVNMEHLQGRVLKMLVLRKLGREAEAQEVLHGTLLLDPLDPISRWVGTRSIPRDGEIGLDIAFDLARAGFLREAVEVLETGDWGAGTKPRIGYAKATFLNQLGDVAGAKRARTAAANASPDYCFPARMEEIAILEEAIAMEPGDARARYYLGNLFYDRRRHEEAIVLWEKAARLDTAFAVTWRNLGIGYFNIRHDAKPAVEAYDKAVAGNPDDARLVYERDQLWKRIGESPKRRLAELERHLQSVPQRDDLSIELCTLYNQTGQPEKALKVLHSRAFSPGRVVRDWRWANMCGPICCWDARR